MLVILHSNNNYNGPGKVIKNLKLGLESSCIEYKENEYSFKDDDYILSLDGTGVDSVLNKKNLIIGPNVCTLPIDNTFVMNNQYKKIITPSKWVFDLYSRWIDKEKITIWPVGIDTDFFINSSYKEKNTDCLIYFKRRNVEDLNYCISVLQEFNQSYKLIEYGKYDESYFLKSISSCKYCIVIDSSESQGIAIEEIMSSNLPIFMWDVTEWVDRGAEYVCRSSSAPYWSEECGCKIFEKSAFKDMFNIFLLEFNKYNPRDYIINNLSLEKQAIEILNEFKK